MMMLCVSRPAVYSQTDPLTADLRPVKSEGHTGVKEFSSIQNGICAFGKKAHNVLFPPLESFSTVQNSSSKKTSNQKLR